MQICANLGDKKTWPDMAQISLSQPDFEELDKLVEIRKVDHAAMHFFRANFVGELRKIQSLANRFGIGN